MASCGRSLQFVTDLEQVTRPHISMKILSVSVEKTQILSLIQVIFCTLTVAMRYEPANIKFFNAEVSDHPVY